MAKSIEEKNKVIAEFMQIRTIMHKDKFRTNKELHLINKNDDIICRVEYHKSWDDLMPVVEKIEKTGYNISIIGNECEIEKSCNPLSLISYAEPTKILAVFKAVYQFITEIPKT